MVVFQTILARCVARCTSLSTPAAPYRGAVEHFAKDSSGAVAVIFALITVALCLFVGAGVDIGRWLHARQQTLSAMDAAVLAGGRALQLNPNDASAAVAAAQTFYAENTKNRLPLLTDTITFQPAENNTAFTATGNAYIATPLLGFVNIPKLPLLATSGAEYSKSALATGGASKGSVEIGLMLDVTGSMRGTKFDDLKEAASDLITIVVSENQGQFPSRVAVIPFAEDIRLPSSASSVARGSGLPNSVTVGSGRSRTTYRLTPCVVERKGTEKYTDATPASNAYVMADYTSSGNCDLSSSAELMPLSGNKSALLSKIDGLSLAGGTAGHLGTAWAWYTLSPNWNSLWGSANQAAGYGADKLQKIAILMTDGEYNTEYDTHGIQVGSSGAGSAANGTSTNQARALCTAMKAKGIIVYTVGFDLGGNQTAIDTLSGCATDSSKFYNADNGDQLKQAFRDIALKISQLYLSQ